ncbi:MAG TPA: DNA polymerase IV [Patescibacteria group bacterium]|nr:DNA polymerase IV [Patescibacteria group bacterium]
MRTIMLVDSNSAYLSWTAVSLLEKGYPIDIREIPSVIAGDPKSRHGIILAKSIPTKKYGISTGQSLFEARQKCPDLAVFPANYDLYMLCSNAMYQILLEYSPRIERYSIDECYLDFTASQRHFGDPITVAHEIKERIKDELGFTVNVGVSCNKLLAKMGSELKTPDLVHTLYPDEIAVKLWPLPIRELFMIGRASEEKLKKININTIGDLAKADPLHMKALMKSHGLLVWAYANGIDDSEVMLNSSIIQKGVGNSTTITYDVTTREDAHLILLALTERVGMRLRKLGYMASLVSVSVKTDGFIHYSHQLQLQNSINTTDEIYNFVCLLFDQCWKREPIRHLGVSVSDFSSADMRQLSLFDRMDMVKIQKLDKIVDIIRAKYGTRSIIRGSFVNGNVNPVQGGTNDSDYIMMGGYTQN